MQTNGVEKAKKQPPKKTEKAPKVVKVVEPKPKAVKETKKPATKPAKKTAAKSKPEAAPEPMDEEEEVVEIPRELQSTAVKRAVHFEMEPAAPAVVPQVPKAVVKNAPQKPHPATNGNGVHVVPMVAKKAQANTAIFHHEIADELPDIIAPPVPMVPPAAVVQIPAQKTKPKKAPTTVRGTFDEYANGKPYLRSWR